MNHTKIIFSFVLIFSVMLIPFLLLNASAEKVPDWIRNTALWYGEGKVSETEFLNAIKFLVENNVIILEREDIISVENLSALIIIPNGNVNLSNSAFYKPLNLEIASGTVVTWINEDSVEHTIQSQDESGNNNGLFHSSTLGTGETFEFTFEEMGVYNYYCSFHPWRVGLVTVK